MTEVRTVDELLSSSQPTEVRTVDELLSSSQPTEVRTVDELLSSSQPTEVRSDNELLSTQPTSIIKDQDNLDTSSKWLSNAATIYEAEEGEKWKGSQKGLSDWFKDRHSKLGFDMTNMGITAYGMSDMSDKVKQAWIDSMTTYDQTDADLASFGRATWHAITDPVGIASIVGGLGVGGLVKAFGSRGASIAGRTLFKDQLQKALLKKGLTKEVIEEGTSKAVQEKVKDATKEVIKSRGREWALRGGASGVGWGGLENVLDQSVEISLDYDPDKYLASIAEGKSAEQAREDARKSDIDGGELAGSAAIGAVFGGVLGRGMSRFASKKEAKKILNQQDYLATKAATPKSDNIVSNITDGTSNRDVASEANRAQMELNVGGTVDIDTSGRREFFNNEITRLKQEAKDIKKTKAWRDKSNKQKNSWNNRHRQAIKDVIRNKNKAEEDILDTFRQANIEVEKVGKDKYKGTKILESKIEISDMSGKRTLGQKVIAKVKKWTYDSGAVGEEARLARTRLDRAKDVAERNVQTRFRNLEKAIKNSYGQKLNALSKDTYSLMNSALRGDEVAQQKLSQEAPEVLENIKEMRENIQDLQERLLRSGAIDPHIDKNPDSPTFGQPTGLYATIQKSMTGEDGAELYINRQYEVFDNPEWGNMINETEEGQKVAYKAKALLAIEHAKKDKEFSKAKKLFDSRQPLTPDQQRIYDEYMGKNGHLDNIITDILAMNDEDDLFKIFGNNKDIFITKDKAGKILTRREDIPKEIRMLMGEYDDPFTNYANTAIKLFQTMETYNYEKDIADLIRRGAIEGAGIRRDAAQEIRVPLESKLPSAKGVERPLEPEPEFRTPLKGLYGTSEVADYIAQGNEINVVQFKPLQQYLMLQGHTRSAKTVWSPTAIARNFIGGGWMAAGAGYLSPRHLKQIPRVMKSLASKSDTELNSEIEKGIALGYLQSGTELGAFKGAMKDATKNNFWDFTSPAYKDANSLKEKAKRANTSAVKFYQSMDDMWKQYAFMNEAGNYRKILEDQGVNPDEVVRRFMSGDGLEVKITRLDEAAANAVNKHMQNYAGVPKFIKGMRVLPMADFLAFKSEIIRTQKNILKSAFNDIKEGNAMMKTGQKRADGQLKGQAQRSLGYKRLGSIIAAQAAGPALALGSAQMLGLNEKEPGATNTIKEGIEAMDAPYNKGSNFIYYGVPKKGKGKRVNISYINPWAATQGPIAAAFAASRRGENVENSIDLAFQDSIIQPLVDTFSPSMLAEAALTFTQNRDERGRPIFREGDPMQTKIANGITTLLKPFEAGVIKSARDIVTSYNLPGQEFGVTAKGRKIDTTDQLFGLTGVKPEEYDVKVGLGFKVSDLKRRMGDVDKIFREAYQQRSPTTVNELADSYDQVLKTQFSLATQMFDYISKARSAGLSNTDIYKAITDEGLFPKRADKKVLYNMVNKGVFVPPPPKFSDMVKWGVSTKRMTGQKPPIREAQRELMNTYRSYVGSRTGVR